MLKYFLQEKKKHSFTVVEVIVVVIIISLLAIVGIPNFRKVYRRVKFENVAQRVYSFCHYAHNYALTKHRLIIMEIDLDENLLSLKDQDKTIRSLKLPPQYKLKSDLSKIGFGYFGAFELHDFDTSKKQTKPNGYIKITNITGGWEAEIFFNAYWGIIELRFL